MQNISSFALYGFPESHAASFALIAYASAYFKVKYLAAFTCAILNNQPMGFYTPAVLVKDAQRHGLRVKPIDIQVSDWPCTIEHEPDGSLSLRMGLGYAKGLRKKAAEALVASRAAHGPFRSAEDLAQRVPCSIIRSWRFLPGSERSISSTGLSIAAMLSGRWNAPESSKAHCSERVWNHWLMTRRRCLSIK